MKDQETAVILKDDKMKIITEERESGKILFQKEGWKCSFWNTRILQKYLREFRNHRRHLAHNRQWKFSEC